MTSLLEKLPDVRGRYKENAPLGTSGWFKCGGVAEIQFKPADLEDLQDFLRQCPDDIPINIFGALSNSIIRDGGLEGVTIRLPREFAKIEIKDDCVVAGALALDANVAQVSAEAGRSGLEFLSGIPGSTGGALRMNAGCYGTEIKDVLISCQALDKSGELHNFTPEEMGMSYRHIDLSTDYIFTNATFRTEKESPETVQARIADIKKSREDSQPIREKTGGSTFANPSVVDLEKAGLPLDTKVWKIIDSVGGRGLTIGGAMMSEKHCNFMINNGTAMAQDLEDLGEEIRKRVLDKYGITLRWEIRRIGKKSGEIA